MSNLDCQEVFTVTMPWVIREISASCTFNPNCYPAERSGSVVESGAKRWETRIGEQTPNMPNQLVFSPLIIATSPPLFTSSPHL